MQTRSMTLRAGVPHDLEAFDSYSEDFFQTPRRRIRRTMEWDEDSDDDSSFSPSDDDEEKVVPERPPRWPEELPTFREVFTRSQWRTYIEEIHDVLEEGYFLEHLHELTTSEYDAVKARAGDLPPAFTN